MKKQIIIFLSCLTICVTFFAAEHRPALLMVPQQRMTYVFMVSQRLQLGQKNLLIRNYGTQSITPQSPKQTLLYGSPLSTPFRIDIRDKALRPQRHKIFA